MLKQKVKKSSIANVRTLVVTAVTAFALVGGVFLTNVHTRADEFDAKIRALQNQNDKNQAASSDLADKATSYQDKVNKLEQQINDLQQKIVANQKASDVLQAKIDKEQKDLENQQAILAEDIKTMYLEGQISTLEILASSHDLSDFVNKEADRVAVQNKIKSTVDEIRGLQVKLEIQQRELQSRIRDQQDIKAQLSSSQSQQTQLLSYTEEQKAALDQAIRSNNSKIASLRLQQLAANQALGGNVVAGDPNHGNYPANWDHAAQDSLIDSWGMFNRECVSYTAWKVFERYGYMPYWGGHGNANQWPASARADHISTGSVPRVGSVAISMGGAYGHAMWVEAVNGSTIYVSQYNYDLAGHYSEMSLNGSGLVYIYFH